MSQRGISTLPLVKVKEKFQVTIPTMLRKALNLSVGDILEAVIEEDELVFKPQTVVHRKAAWDQLFAVMDRVHAKLPPSTQSPQEQEEEIAREIKAYRKKHARDRRS